MLSLSAPEENPVHAFLLVSVLSGDLGVPWLVDAFISASPTPVFLPGESQKQGSLVGCHLWGRTESDTTEATQQQQQQLSSHDLSPVCW